MISSINTVLFSPPCKRELDRNDLAYIDSAYGMLCSFASAINDKPFVIEVFKGNEKARVIASGLSFSIRGNETRSIEFTAKAGKLFTVSEKAVFTLVNDPALGKRLLVEDESASEAFFCIWLDMIVGGQFTDSLEGMMESEAQPYYSYRHYKEEILVFNKEDNTALVLSEHGDSSLSHYGEHVIECKDGELITLKVEHVLHPRRIKKQLVVKDRSGFIMSIPHPDGEEVVIWSLGEPNEGHCSPYFDYALSYADFGQELPLSVLTPTFNKDYTGFSCKSDVTYPSDLIQEEYTLESSGVADNSSLYLDTLYLIEDEKIKTLLTRAGYDTSPKKAENKSAKDDILNELKFFRGWRTLIPQWAKKYFR